MEWIIANYDLIIVLLLIIFTTGYQIYNFLTSPSEKRQELMRIWLISAVTKAELTWTDKGLGYVKFSQVYQELIKHYGLLAKFIPKETVDKLINEALVIMKETLNKNKGDK